MRKVLAVLSVLAALVFVVLGVALWNANRLVQRYQPALEALASDAVGAPVTFGRVSASILPSARLEVGDITVGGPDGLALASMALHLRLLPLLGGRLDVVKLALDRPDVVVVKDDEGLRIAGLPRRKAEPARPAETPTTTRGGGGGDGGGVAPAVALTLRAFELRDATVEYHDAARKTTFTVSELDVDAALEVDADEVRIPTFEAEATAQGSLAVEARGRDIHYAVATGRATVPEIEASLDGQTVRVGGTVDTRAGAGEVTVGSEALDLAKLAAALAPLAPGAAEAEPAGTAKVDARATFGPGKALDAAGEVTLADVAAHTGAGAVSALAGVVKLAATATQRTVASDQLRFQLNGEPVTASFAAEATDDLATLRSLVARVFGGTARASGTYVPATRRFTADLGAESLDVAKVLTTLQPKEPNPLSGTLSQFQARIGGTALDDPDATQRSLVGQGSVALVNGRWAGTNLLGEVLDALRKIPVVSRVVGEAIPADVRGMAEGDDTQIGSLRSDFTLGDAALRLANLSLVNPALAFDGGGRVGFDRRVDLAGTVALSPNVSRSIAGRVKEVQAVLDPVGRLAVPVTIRGTPPRVAVVPDVARLTTGVARKAIENQATKLLRDAFGNLKKEKKGAKKGDQGLPFGLPRF